MTPYLRKMEAFEPWMRAFVWGEPTGFVSVATALGPGELLFGVKDNMACESCPPPRCGARLPAASHGLGREATCVRRLRSCGGVVAGKTRLAEFAALTPPETRNPRDERRTPGGSSSGSAAAVAAGCVDAALGTQTIGSIGRPASFCGVVGLSPSFGRVDRTGVDLYSESVDVVGCLAKDVSTATRVAACVYDDFDEARVSQGDVDVVVVPDGRYLEDSFDPLALRLFERALERLRRCPTIRVVRAANVLDDIHDVAARHRELITSDLARAHSARFSDFRDLYSPETRDLLDGAAARGPATEAARRSPAALRATLTAALRGRSAFIAPGAASGVAPLGLETTGDPAAQLPWSHAGLPALTLPAGTDDATGMPHAVQIVAAHGQDEILLNLGAKLERDVFRPLPLADEPAAPRGA